MLSLSEHPDYYKKKIFFHPMQEWVKNIVNFGEQKMLKGNFWKSKNVIKIDDIDVNKVLVSKEEPYGSKKFYFIRYNDNDVIRPLCVKLPQMVEYVKSFESNTTMFFRITDKQLLKKYDQI